MTILINASNLGPGGATQVADSFCCTLNRYENISFVVVLTPQMINILEKIKGYQNVTIYIYQFKNNWKTYLFARDRFLDNLVKTLCIDVVFSIFAPTWWTPRRPHLCGFALAHLVMPESPYFKRMSIIQRFKQRIQNAIMIFFYWRCSRNYYTENPLITQRLKKLLHCNNVYTITNYYNQIFDQPEKQHYKHLPPFNGITLLSVSNNYPHKNLAISIEIAKFLKENHPDFAFRFVFTIKANDFPVIPNDIRNHFLFIGCVDISECPSLYEQCDIVFQPTLLECFTATYVEAMRMKRPIITTNLEFAKGLCGDAALYYSPLNSANAAQTIYELAKNEKLIAEKVLQGTRRLKQFDNYFDRSKKIIRICLSLKS